METKMIRVLLADDTLIAREGWKKILDEAKDIEVVGEATYALEISRKVSDLKPDIVLMDLNWFGDRDAGWITIQDLKADHPDLKIIAVTAYEELIKKARQVGADTAFTKTFTKDQLIGGIRDLAAREISNPLAGPKAEFAPVNNLTAREKDVLELLVKGYQDREISDALGIAVSTAKNHVKSILSKLNASNRTEAANIARELGLIGNTVE